jgi:hypothetical protein
VVKVVVAMRSTEVGELMRTGGTCSENSAESVMAFLELREW